MPAKTQPKKTNPLREKIRELEELAAQYGGWRWNKYKGVTGISCWTCQWFQPLFQEENSHGPREQAQVSAAGFCRNISPIHPCIWGEFEYDDKGGEFTSVINGPISEGLLWNAKEFWCRSWVRTRNPFPEPPIYGGGGNGHSIDK